MDQNFLCSRQPKLHLLINPVNLLPVSLYSPIQFNPQPLRPLIPVIPEFSLFPHLVSFLKQKSAKKLLGPSLFPSPKEKARPFRTPFLFGPTCANLFSKISEPKGFRSPLPCFLATTFLFSLKIFPLLLIQKSLLVPRSFTRIISWTLSLLFKARDASFLFT